MRTLKVLNLNFFVFQLDGPKAGQAITDEEEQDFYNQAYGA